MKHLPASSLLIALLSVLFSCSEKVAGPGSETETISVAGQVQYPDGAIAANAIVMIRHTYFLPDTVNGIITPQSAAGDAVTAADGSFKLDSLENEDYILEINDGKSHAASMLLEAGDTWSAGKLSVTLKPAAAITGKVSFNGSKESLANAYIQIYGLNRLSKTDSLGNFKLDLLPEGKHLLRVSPNNSHYGYKIVPDILLQAGAALPLSEISLNSVCEHFTCDTSQVRFLLGENNLANINISDVISVDPVSSRITSLDLSNTELTTLPEEIQNLVTLESLTLDSNRIAVVPRVISRLINLKTLDISHNRLVSIPSDLNQLQQLRSLDLSFNSLTSVHSEYGDLRQLNVLNLSNNSLTSVPDELGDLSSLTQLDLSNNVIETVHNEYGKLSNLAYMDVSYNNISSLPDELGNLTALTHFSASNNKISTIHTEMGDLLNLQTLLFNNNELTSIPKELANLASLTSLDIGANSICGELDAALTVWLLAKDADWQATQRCTE